MTNKITISQFNEIKDKGICVIAFKFGKRTMSYGNLSYVQAIELVFEREKRGEVCLIIPFVNELMSGINGLGLHNYEDYKESLEYYLKCIEGFK
mgnify:CR=1 FL=1